MQIGRVENEVLWDLSNRDEFIQNSLHGPTEFSAGLKNL